ncbi:MAG: hypothetical protein P4L00_10180 [Candidatus Acidoferrales bacterium]|nr:hypothetical protein [Candidatus Acidoferrales bacterium]
MIVIFAFPEFVNVIVCGLVLPTTTLPKLKLPGLAPSVPSAATALPVIVSVWGEPGAWSVKTMLPLAPIVDVGENWTLKDMFWPAAIVLGRARPLIPKPGPEIVARFKTRLEFPLFVKVMFCVLLCPTGTLLKFNDAGEIVSPGCVPVPLSEIASCEFEASLITVTVPVAAPAAVGAN